MCIDLGLYLADRGKLHNIINQRESRLNLEIAVQQHRLADASSYENASMKTLTFLGSLFLPVTFLSSVFGMPFFDFTGGTFLFLHVCSSQHKQVFPRLC